MPPITPADTTPEIEVTICPISAAPLRASRSKGTRPITKLAQRTRLNLFPKLRVNLLPTFKSYTLN